MKEFRAFLEWVTGKESMSQAGDRLGVGRRTFARRIAWCWNVRPRVAPDGVARHCVEVDGTYLPYGRCLLAAVDGLTGEVVAWQWCGRETTAAYGQLFRRLARPDCLVADGGPGCMGAARGAWPGVRVQRCLVHVLRDTRRDLTDRPRTDAGRELLSLARRLTRVRSIDDAARWLAALNAWHNTYGGFIRQRTYARDDPANPKARAGRTWWWTHERLRRAYHRLVRLNRDGVLFAFCDPAITAGGPVPSTTNRLEGGVNADVKRVAYAHRGLNDAHMRRACEWVLYMKTRDPDPESFVTPECWTPPPSPSPRPAHGDGPAPGTETQVQLPAPGVDAYEGGFGIRKGWAGRP